MNIMNVNGASAELQQISLVGFVNDVYLLAKCCEIVNESFYSDLALKLIYRTLKDFYKRYMKLPSLGEHILLIDKTYTEEYGDKENIIESCKRIYSDKDNLTSEDFVYDNVIDFIRRNKVEQALSKAVSYMKDGSINLDEIADDLKDSVTLNFSKAPAYNLADIGRIADVRADALGGDSNPMTVKFFIDSVNKCMQYKALIPGTLNMVVGPPGRGKTTLLINQGVSAAQQGYMTLHVFLGDMSRFDGLIRYVSCLSGVPSSTIVEMNNDELSKFVKKWNMTGVLSNVDIASYAADELTANQLIEEITSIQKANNVHYNQIIVDYDENIAYESDSIYSSGGSVYNKLALFAITNKSVVFIASQPKPEFWDQEIIPLNAAAESSKKQKIVDLMITLGKPSKSSSVGTLFLAKNRRGIDSKVIRLSISGDNARFEQITEDEYNRIKSIERSSSSQRIQ